MALHPRVLPVATPWQIIVMSMMAGVTIANIYYCQPILALIAASLNISALQTGMLPVWTQVGYSIGLFFIAPLGDIFDRKKLIILLQILMLVIIFSATQVHSLTALSLVCFGIGLLGVSVQVVVPMAASLALPSGKGRVVGKVFTGTLTGFSCARCQWMCCRMARLAPWFDKMSDRVDPRCTQIYSVLLMVLGALTLQFWHNAVGAIIVATLLLDISYFWPNKD